ncbi:hypothetical protein HH303_17800 [Rhodospirillaceae bacterium KN72]|uniref:Flagellar hook-length control protein-like C-terminal domain-containing protein n=1 Tax=Pacificispira spongiicola TaxID=2729598 RepID=A0A7Y0E333_9PROT|nr:flagellar hook-length control protein FliK [Pacificispira spongiicola]NMM46350.1 hypothetical protein [Pacificispira spongiicola]
MSVTSANDTMYELYGSDARRSATERSKDKDRSQQDAQTDGGTVASQFSALLQNRMSNNFGSARVDQSLELPERASSDRQEAPVVERRDTSERHDDRDDYEKADRPDDANRDQAATAPITDPTIESTLPTTTVETGEVDALADTGDAPVQAQAAAAAQSGKTETKDGAANQAATLNDATKKAPKTEVAANAGDAEEISPELTEAAKEAAKKGSGKAQVTVTDADAKLTSQPQTTLSAKAAVDAAAGARKAQNAEMVASADAESAAATEAEENANTIFNRVKAQNTPAGAKAADAAANAKTDMPTADAPKANAQQTPTPANQNTQPGFGLSGMGTAGKQTSGLTGTTQSGMTVDGATGGAATLGENNAVQQRSMPTQTPANAAARNAAMPNQALTDQVAVNIQKGAAQGQDKITIQLRPAELGKVEVKMEVTHDGKMTAVVSAERPETLDMLRQDARHLLQSLNDAGLQADQNSLSFSLQGQDAGGNRSETGQNMASAETMGPDDDLIQSGFIFEETGGFKGDGRLDVRI